MFDEEARRIHTDARFDRVRLPFEVVIEIFSHQQHLQKLKSDDDVSGPGSSAGVRIVELVVGREPKNKMKKSTASERKDEMRRKVFHHRIVALFLREQKELGNHREGLQITRERPRHVGPKVTVQRGVHDQSEKQARYDNPHVTVSGRNALVVAKDIQVLTVRPIEWPDE